MKSKNGILISGQTVHKGIFEKSELDLRTTISIDRAILRELIAYNCVRVGKNGKILGITRVVNEALLWFVTFKHKSFRYPEEIKKD